jgi:hypothetical protein
MARLAQICGAAFVISAMAFGNGCAPSDADAAERLREALPVQEDVALKVPSGSSGTGTTTHTSSLHIATNGATPAGTAQYYQLTRDLTAGVDLGTAAILGIVWAIVHAAPTLIEPKKLVWGPGAGNALDPVVWRFTATELTDGEYDYVLEGQPRAGGAFVSVLTGHGYSASRPEHNQGYFAFDNDASKKLDPSRGHDDGTAKVTYDLRQLPVTLAVELRHPAAPAEGWMDILVTHEAQSAGSISVKGATNTDPLKTTKLEDLTLLSRWTSNGSGRADAVLKNGDLPITVNASECWSTSFARVFYKDTVDFEPATGDASVCVFPPATL